MGVEVDVGERVDA